jgi:hypothetical protein
MDYSTFFEVADQIQSPAPLPTHKLYYDEKGAIIDISYDLLEHDYIVITQDEFDACNNKRDDYTVIENKLTFTPPKQRTWGLIQQELARNPYVKS